MTAFLYKSTTGKPFRVESYTVTVSGVELPQKVKALDALVGTSITRYTDGVLDIIDTSGSSILASGSRTLGSVDDDTVIKCTIATILTIPSDIVGKFIGTETISSYQASTGAVTFIGSGAFIRGTPRASAQYIVQTIKRVAANEWAYSA